MTRYQVRNILARLCFAPDDSQPLGADASFSLLPGRMISNSFHLLASFNFRWHLISSSASPSQTPLIKLCKIAHVNINFNTSILTPHLNNRVKTNLNISFVFPLYKINFLKPVPDPPRDKNPTPTPTHPPPLINRLTENEF